MLPQPLVVKLMNDGELIIIKVNAKMEQTQQQQEATDRVAQGKLQSKQRVGKRRATNEEVRAEIELARAAASSFTRKHNEMRHNRAIGHELRRDREEA